MPKIAKELGPLAVKSISKPGYHRVGGVRGLCLQVVSGTGKKPVTVRTWVLRYKFGGRRRDLGLGPYPEVPLQQAREKAREARDKITAHIDPIAERQQARSAALAEAEKGRAFQQCAEEYIAAHEASWDNAKHAQQWNNTLTTYVYPHIGSLLVAHVELAHIMRILEQPAEKLKPQGPTLWVGKTETASRVQGRIARILSWATTRGYRTGPNPALWKGNLDTLLPRPSKVQKEEKHPALAVGDIGAFVAELRKREGIAAKALEFAILTAARSGEVRGTLWSEIDLQAKTWVLPPERMKARREHRCPLSDAAVRLLRSLPRTEGVDLVFPAPNGSTLSDMTLTAVIRRMNEAHDKPVWVDPQSHRPATPHGTARATFRTWVGDRTRYPTELAEAQLAHVVGDKTVQAYARGDLFDRRRALMQEWARFLSHVETKADKGNVLDIQTARPRA